MATREDAALMMQILQWGTAAGMMESMVELMAPQFDPDSADAMDRGVFSMLLLGETIGTFVKQGLLDKGLVYDLWAASMMWSRVAPAALKQREQYGEPRLWENFEALATGAL